MTDSKIETLLRCGIWMGDDKPVSWALTVKQVNAILNELEQTSVPILGGDVYEYENGYFKPAHMNWYSDPKFDEPESEFAIRSVDETREYLNSISKIAHKYMYALVLGKTRKGVAVDQPYF